MQDFQKRRGYKAQLLRMVLGLAGLACLALVAYAATRGAWHMYGKFTQAAAAREAGEARLAELRREHARVETGVEELGSARGIEAEVRERYGLGRPGEGAIVVVRQEGEAAAPIGEPNILQKLLDAFFVW